MPTNPKRGWRVGGDPAAEAAPNWRKATARAPDAPRRKLSRRTLFLLALGLLLGTIGGAIWVATRLMPPSPAHLVVVSAHYANQLAVPHNLHGWNAAKALHAFADLEDWKFLWLEKRLFGQPTPHALEATSLTKWAEGLKGRPEKTLLLYFAVHGGVDEKGPYLLPEGFDPYAAETAGPRLRVDNLLAELPPEKNKLLILDVTHVTACWPLGLLHNDFARQLESKLEKVRQQIPNLIVLSASSPGQRSWPSDVKRRTVFGQYVLEGLAGNADRDRSGRVTARELIDSVKEGVEAWAVANRDELQTPFEWTNTDPAKIDLVVAKGELSEKAKKVVAAGRPSAPAEDQEDEEARRARKEREDLIAKKLAAAWSDCDRLRTKQLPQPAVYSPHQWRRYQDTLLRYEEVLLAEDPAEKTAEEIGQVVAALEANLETLKKDIEAAAACEVPRGVLGSALPMPAVFGRHPQSDKPDEQLRHWRDCDGLLRNLAKGDLDRKTAVEQLQALTVRDKLRPAEVHYLLMLHKELAGRPEKQTPGVERVRQAVGVRLLAEEAALAAGAADQHPFAEWVYRWVENPVTKADRERRLGEDWLLGDRAEHWTKAKEHFDKAEELYREAQKTAHVVRTALDASARAQSDLPYYSLWAARRRLPSDPARQREVVARTGALVKQLEEVWEYTPEPDGPDGLVRQLVLLWEKAHDLAGRLRRPDTKSADLEDLAKKLDRSLGVLEDELDKYAAKLAGLSNQHQHWHALDGLLATPLLPALHVRLRDQRRDSSQHWHDRHTSNPRASAQAVQTQDAEAAARRQGRLAVAALGREWVDQQAKGTHGTDSYDQLMGRMSRPAEIGWQVGLLWRLLPGEVQKLAEPAAGEPDLAAAVARCRQLDGAAAGRVMGEPVKNYRSELVSPDPVQAYRRRELSLLLVGQGRRVWFDHWAGFGSQAEQPYYRAASGACLDAAQELALRDVRDEALDKSRRAEIKADREKLAETHVVVEPGAKSLDLTTEHSFALTWAIRRGDAPAEAVPMYRVVTSKGVKAAKEGEDLLALKPSENWPSGERKHELYCQALRDEEEHPQPIPLRGPIAPRESASLELRFRGRTIAEETKLTLYLGADTAAFKLPPPPAAELAVEAEENIPRGAVAIIVDYSNSMAGAKIKAAREALATVLAKLGDGTMLSVLVFGHTKNGGKVETIRPVSPWHSSQLEPLKAKLALEPKHMTHLVEAMLQARNELLENRQCQGLYKTILVLTDGEDTTYAPPWIENDPVNARQRAQKIDRAVRQGFSVEALKGEKIMINMVLFGDNKAERDRAGDQFESALKSLPEPGTFEPAGAAQLVKILYEGLRPRLRLLLEGEPVDAKDPRGYPVYFHRERGDWIWSRLEKPPPNRFYTAEIYTHSREVRIDPGDCLLINLKRDGQSGLQFERRLSKDIYGRGPGRWTNATLGAAKADWLLTVHQNQHVVQSTSTSTGRGLNVVAAIENENNVLRRGGVIGQPKSTWQWFELHDGTNQPAGLRWHNFFGLPAPTWNLRVPDWPKARGGLAPPTVKAWWLAGDPIGQVVPATFRYHKNDDLEKKIEQAKYPLGEVSVQIESIKPQKRRVQVAPGKFEEQPCLVVRLHSPGSPVWVRLSGQPDVKGEEHYFYRDPGKTTVVFWPVRDVLANDFTLNLMPVEALKAHAFRAELPLGTPQENDTAPDLRDLSRRADEPAASP